MATPTTPTDLIEVIRKSRLLTDDVLNRFLHQNEAVESPTQLIGRLEAAGLLTRFQSEQLIKGRHKGFVLGKYRLLDRIGMGGMGQVYLAEHASMKRRVALKVLPPDRGKSDFARERFLREARAAAAIEHNNLVRAFDIEMDGDVAFLVMEYIDGVTLHELIARRGKLDAGRAAHYLWQIASGLQAIHHRSLVHRDIKPANLLLDRGGVVRILDLGLVRSELDDDALTRGEGATIVGTADYIAPEQAVACSQVDGRADLYSLGCTAYYLLTGQPPFPGEKISAKLIAHQAYTPRPIRELNPAVPDELIAIIDRLLAKKPELRPQSGAEVMDLLAPFAKAGLPTSDDFPQSKLHNGTAGEPSPGWVSFNATATSSESSSSGASGSGSSIRFSTDVPPSGLSLASQRTATVGQADTLPTRPAPSQVAPTVTTEKPVVKPVIKPRPAPVVPVNVRTPPPKVLVNSTAVKATALFRTTNEKVGSSAPPKGNVLVPVLSTLLAGMVGLVVWLLVTK